MGTQSELVPVPNYARLPTKTGIKGLPAPADNSLSVV
jgi:hypothetical protein